MNLISITPEARLQLTRQIQKIQQPGVVLSITPSGCNGYQYELGISNDIKDTHYVVFLDNNSWLAVDSTDLWLLQGLVIDYVKEGLNGKFVYNNPNSLGTCGCGKSFNI